MEATTIHCKFCQGERETNGAVCLGCGSDISQARVKPKKQLRNCPKCSSHRASELDEYRYTCRDCGAVFEDLDFSFLDDRPHIALEKKERQELAAKRRRRRAR